MKLALVLVMPLILVVTFSLAPLARRNEWMTADQHEALISSERIYRLMNAPMAYALITYCAYYVWISGLNGRPLLLPVLMGTDWAYSVVLDKWSDRNLLLENKLRPALEERRKLLSMKFDKPGKPLVLERI